MGEKLLAFGTKKSLKTDKELSIPKVKTKAKYTRFDILLLTYLFIRLWRIIPITNIPKIIYAKSFLIGNINTQTGKKQTKKIKL